MALWHFIKNTENGPEGVSWDEGGATVSSFDDGLCFLPGEEQFSREAADAKAESLGEGITAELTGVPGYQARMEREAQEAAEAQQRDDARLAAEAQLDAMLNPIMPEDAERAAINQKFDVLLSAAPDRAEDIEKLRKEALQALEG